MTALLREVRWRFAAGYAEAAIAESIGTSERRVKQLVKSEDLESDWEPWCMTPEDFEAWRGRSSSVNGFRAGAAWRDEGGLMRPCQDCSASFAAAARAEDRCNGTPGQRRRAGRPDVPFVAQPPPAEEELPVIEPTVVDVAPDEPVSDELRDPQTLAELAVMDEWGSLLLAIDNLEADLSEALARADQVRAELDDVYTRARATKAALDSLLSRPAPEAEPLTELDVAEAFDVALEVVTTAPQDEAVPAEPGSDAPAVATAASSDLSRLSRRQRMVLDALTGSGSIAEAARSLGWANSTTNAALHEIGKKGLLPLDLIAVLPASFAKYASVPA